VDKAALRRRMKAARLQLVEGREAELAAAFADVFLEAIPRTPGACVAGYHALPGELDPAPLLEALGDLGHPLALPVVTQRGAPLTFRSWRPGDPLVRGSFGVQEPTEHAAEVQPDVILVPLLAWDDRGHRLGYGGGYYDRTLAAHPHAAHLGCSLVGLRVERVPTEPWDVPLHAVVHEEGVHRPR
jgi:5-formyltetrahydrofolate cyclo-ligase